MSQDLEEGILGEERARQELAVSPLVPGHMVR